MGGAVALAAAGKVRVSAVADLSGAVSWPGVPLAASAPRVRVPALVASSRQTDGTDHDELQRAFARIPVRQKVFISAPSGHGWGLLTDIEGGRTVLTPMAPRLADWIRAGR